MLVGGSLGLYPGASGKQKAYKNGCLQREPACQGGEHPGHCHFARHLYERPLVLIGKSRMAGLGKNVSIGRDPQRMSVVETFLKSEKPNSCLFFMLPLLFLFFFLKKEMCQFKPLNSFFM